MILQNISNYLWADRTNYSRRLNLHMKKIKTLNEQVPLPWNVKEHYSMDFMILQFGRHILAIAF